MALLKPYAPGGTPQRRTRFLWGVTIFWNAVAWPVYLSIWLTGGPWWARIVFALHPLIGLGLLIYVLRAPLVRLRVQSAVVLANQETFAPGDRVRLQYKQGFKRETEVQGGALELVAQETVTYSAGTSQNTLTHSWSLERLSVPPGHYSPERPLALEVHWTIPATAMHTFAASDNQFRYFLRARLDIPHWPDYREDFEIVVRPEVAPEEEADAQGRDSDSF
jgi:hypothetical protein